MKSYYLILFGCALALLAGCQTTVNIESSPEAPSVPEEVQESEAEMTIRAVTYGLDGVSFESTVVYEAGEEDPMPGVLMVPNWMGPTEPSLEKAMMVAEEGVVVMMVDMYGVDVRPTSMEEASAAAGFVRADRDLMRARLGKAHEVLKLQADVPLDTEKLAAIGFCFGGGSVLEYARSGADLDLVVSFHGDLESPTLREDSDQITSRVLVLHGAEDPYVPQEHVAAFRDVMLATEVDWTFVQFANAVHSFTDPLASMPGQAEYHPEVAAQAFEMMEDAFEFVWEED